LPLNLWQGSAAVGNSNVQGDSSNGGTYEAVGNSNVQGGDSSDVGTYEVVGNSNVQRDSADVGTYEAVGLPIVPEYAQLHSYAVFIHEFLFSLKQIAHKTAKMHRITLLNRP